LSAWQSYRRVINAVFGRERPAFVEASNFGMVDRVKVVQGGIEAVADVGRLRRPVPVDDGRAFTDGRVGRNVGGSRRDDRRVV